MSCITSTWPSQSTPAPMPIVGIASSRVISRASSARHALEHDREGARVLRPRARRRARARAPSSPRPCTRWPPMRWTACGVSPTWPITGISAATIALDRRGHRHAALELHRVRAALLHAAHRVAQRLLGRDLVGPERHVGDHQRALRRARHEARVVDHLVERHRQRRVVALHDVAERVADEQHVDAGRVEDAREGEVVGGEHRDRLAAALAPRERRDRDAVLACGFQGDGGHRGPPTDLSLATGKRATRRPEDERPHPHVRGRTWIPEARPVLVSRSPSRAPGLRARARLLTAPVSVPGGSERCTGLG